MRQERILVLSFRTTLMKGFDTLQMLTTAIFFHISTFKNNLILAI